MSICDISPVYDQYLVNQKIGTNLLNRILKIPFLVDDIRLGDDDIDGLNS